MLFLHPNLPIVILLLFSLILLVIRVLRPDFAYFWLVAASGALLAWPLVLISRISIPQTIQLAAWQPEIYFNLSPVVLLDSISWAYAFAIITIVLAVVLTGVARVSENNWSDWSGLLLVAAVALLAVYAGNPLTLLLAWGALDTIELLIMLSHVEHSSDHNKVVLPFFVRVIGIVLLVWAVIVARSEGTSAEFSSMPQRANVYLLLAAGLRLGVLPLHLPFYRDIQLSRGKGTMIGLIPGAANLVLLTRAAGVGLPDALSPYLLALAAVAALFSSVLWARAANEVDGQPFWIIGFAALALAAAVRGQAMASLAWGVALLLSGGLLILFSSRHRYLLPIPFLGLLGISALPFTPTWTGGWLFVSPFSIWLVMLVIAQALLIIGYIQHGIRLGRVLSGVERWVRVIYPWGLILLPFSHFLIGWWIWRDSGILFAWQTKVENYLPGLVSLGLVAILMTLGRRAPGIPGPAGDILGKMLSLGWFYRLLWGGYRALAQLIASISAVLEGEGGVLWALLLLVLLLAFLTQTSWGG